MLHNMCVYGYCPALPYTTLHYTRPHYLHGTPPHYTIHPRSYLIGHALFVRVWAHLLPQRAQRNIDDVVLRVILLPRTGKERVF